MTAIAYASGKPHIGNTYEIVFADALARHRRLRGYDVYFQTGTDEHGIKIQKKAEEAGVAPKDFVDRIAGQVRSLYDLMGASYDAFVRTTDPSHEKKVQDVFRKLYAQGDIYKGEYEGMYCEPCEAFFTESQLVEGRCPDCGSEVRFAKEEAYFLRLGKYQKWLESYIEEHPAFILPPSRKNEMVNNFLKPGLKDLCVSRTSFDWGIPVDFAPGHVVYVWIDALTNYITFLGYEAQGEPEERFNKYWPCDTHVIGKDILRFHTIYWPIMLKALGVEQPHTIFGHPWLLAGEGKMSKSKGNVVDPEELVHKYGLDAIRYFLLREMPYGADGAFTYELLAERINGELANVLGNLVSRTFAMARQYFGGAVPPKGPAEGADEELIAFIDALAETVAAKMDAYKASDALAAIFALLRRSNKYIDETVPWILAKDPQMKGRLGAVLYNLLDSIRVSFALLSSFLPQTAEKALSALGTKKAGWSDLRYGELEEGLAIGKLDKLFMRVAGEGEEGAPAPAEEKVGEKPVEFASLEELAKAQMKVGKILSAEKHANADKLLVFMVDIGEEKPRQIVSGIARHYDPASLVGKKVIVATNLKPLSFRGKTSEGMFMMADAKDRPVFLAPEEPETPIGSIVK
jgi:methionyl-tRNA synthetase